MPKLNKIMKFQLTRSAGSVTKFIVIHYTGNKISTHTLRGERDFFFSYSFALGYISTHTLRGERDNNIKQNIQRRRKFQLTRSAGSVTSKKKQQSRRYCISTHTLRGERDFAMRYVA